MKILGFFHDFLCLTGFVRYTYTRLSGLVVITGLMGAGKSTFTVGYLLYLAKKEPDLTFYIVNFDGFQFDKINELHKFDKPELGVRFRPLTNKQFLDYPALSNEGADLLQTPCVIVVDESQVFFPASRTSASNLPSAVTALNRIRHMGIELIFLTPHKNNILSYITDLASTYINLERQSGVPRAFIYISAGYNRDALKNRIKSVFHFKDSNQSLFESSSVHSGAYTRGRTAAFFFGILVFIIGFYFIFDGLLGVFSYPSAIGKAQAKDAPKQSQQVHSVPNSASSLNVLPIGTGFTGRFAGCALIGQKRYCHFYDCNGKAIQPDYTFLSTRKVHIGGKDIELGFFECPEKKGT